MIEIKNMCFSYGDKRIFDGFFADFEAGTSTAIMGASGSGKTTLLNLIAGLIKPDSGQITVGGRVSYLFQSPRLIPSLTVKDNLRIVLKFADGSDKIALEMLEKLNIGDAKDKFPAELSGGMAKRAALARALIYPCDILLIDEPFGELDEENKKSAAEAINAAANGKTLLSVVHDPADAELLHAKILADRKSVV